MKRRFRLFHKRESPYAPEAQAVLEDVRRLAAALQHPADQRQVLHVESERVQRPDGGV